MFRVKSQGSKALPDGFGINDGVNYIKQRLKEQGVDWPFYKMNVPCNDCYNNIASHNVAGHNVASTNIACVAKLCHCNPKAFVSGNY